MSDQRRAAELAKAGFDLWQAGRLEEAVPLYRQALDYADPNFYDLDGYHTEFAAVLATLGRDVDAREQYALALAAAQRSGRDGQTIGALIVRYFLAEHLLKMNSPVEVLATVEPVAFIGSKLDCALGTVQARALWQLGRRSESRTAAFAAIAAASSEEMADETRKALAFIIAAPTG